MKTAPVGETQSPPDHQGPEAGCAHPIKLSYPILEPEPPEGLGERARAPATAALTPCSQCKTSSFILRSRVDRDGLVFVGRGSPGTWDVYARDPADLPLRVIREGKDNNLHVVAVRGTPLERIPR
jgi:hypothetical protein